MFPGLMQDYPLTIHLLLQRMESQYAAKAVTTRRDGRYVTTPYHALLTRVRRLADSLRQQGTRSGDRVSTLLWNGQEHLECYLAVPAIGAVLHTLNARLPKSTVCQMLEEVEPVAVIVDRSLANLLQQIALPRKTRLVLIVDSEKDQRKGPAGKEGGAVWMDYEAFVASGSSNGAWHQLDERSACGICYTSGTAGRAKGVVYSHRSTVLHAMVMLAADGIALSEADVCLPVVPMFHAQGWGFPYGSCLAGANLALSHRASDPASLADLIHNARVTLATGVPTIWINMLEKLRSGEIAPELIRSLRCLPIGGAAVSPNLIQGFSDFGIEVQHCWGMTEVSPLGLVSTRRSSLSDDQWRKLRQYPGVPQVGCEIRVMTDKGMRAQADGKTAGELQIRGLWVADAYFDPGREGFRGGDESFDTETPDQRWLKTGDIAVVDPAGYVRIVDRAKDLIKSGGEWISSIELEASLEEHPSVREAAVVAVADPVWQERPVAFLSLVDHWSGPQPDFSAYLDSRLPRWQIPERFIVLQDLPKGRTGKVDKARLREITRIG